MSSTAADAEALAVALLGSTRPSLVDIWCPQRRHRLARVYELPGGTRVLAAGTRKALTATMLGHDAPAGIDKEGSAGPRAYPIDDIDADSFFLRCRCGSWEADIRRLAADLRAGHAGNVEPIVRRKLLPVPRPDTPNPPSDAGLPTLSG